ncbi:putative Angiogenic factor with G patch and FHA domains 1 [Hypsibius exemplaris]|uniref:Angiogenic factor with G patch and FHA domains 1 n=1 Tax=Hypsibius exemplaris TaxID=2072580 RepID=A0A9X6NCG4_HYPEX|nr:putative Angiogenic factor with G patch and FHA domains 1 [Hypsibius exemplaris]
MATIEDLAAKVQSLERQLERERKYTAELGKQNDELSRELARWKGAIARGDVSTQTDALEETPSTAASSVVEWKSQAGSSIADSVKSFLTKKSIEMESRDFVYSEALGMYVNETNGMMYDGKRYLYYDYRKNVYMVYDETSGSYKEDETRKNPVKFKGKRKKAENIDEEERTDTYSSSEDGEVDDEDGEKSASSIVPCVRIIVYSSSAPGISRGDLSIATCDRAFTFGRDAKRDMILDEDLVSKYHAVISYDHDSSQYRLQDFGSQNGTLLNSRRLSDAKEVSEKHELTHQDLISIGSTILIVHIHANTDTCDDCEPGVVLARAQASRGEIAPVVGVPADASSVKDRHRQKMLEIKKKYGLVKEKYVGPAAPVEPDYVDRSRVRRAVIGSDHPSTERPAAPASVAVPISGDNKGFQMLSKMGWNEGEGLNSKRKADSISEPISTLIRLNETAGLGADSAGEQISMDNDVKSRQQQEKWMKTAKRYQGLPTYTPAEKQASLGASSSKSGNVQWVRGGMNPTADGSA